MAKSSGVHALSSAGKSPDDTEEVSDMEDCGTLLPRPLYCQGSLNEACEAADEGTAGENDVRPLVGMLVGPLLGLEPRDPLGGLRLSTRGFGGILSVSAGMVSKLAPAETRISVSNSFSSSAGLESNATCTV